VNEIVNSIHNIVTERNDDYLDLLNYAIQIGDAEWQQEILTNLKRLNHSEEWQREWAVTEQLWRQFDRINQQLLSLYDSIRETSDDSSKQRLLEQWWQLKLERISVSRQIQAESLSLHSDCESCR
jgi:transcriptional regulator with AAA-type ATPase domain